MSSKYSVEWRFGKHPREEKKWFGGLDREDATFETFNDALLHAGYLMGITQGDHKPIVETRVVVPPSAPEVLCTAGRTGNPFWSRPTILKPWEGSS